MTAADRDYASPHSEIELRLAYDKANRVTSVTESGYAHEYTYVVNTSDDYRDVEYPDGRVIRETHDLRGRVDTIVDRGAGGMGTPVTLADNAYDLNNRQTSRAFANGVTGTWDYDDAGRVSSVEHILAGSPAVAIVRVSYGRDDVGNPLHREDSQEPTHSEVYWYDDANRLTEFKRGTLNGGKTDVATYTTDANLTQRNAWTLDALGNWDEFVKRVSGTSVTEPRTNNKANEYATIDPDGSGGASPISLTHDHNGNLTDDGTYLYDYDIENRMTRVTLKSGPTVLAEYHYDALGRRIRKVIPSGQPNAGTWTYVVNELWQVVSEYKTVSSTTTHIRRYVHAGAGSGAGLSSVRSNAPYVDDHVAMWDVQGSKLYYYHADAQYCTVAMTQESDGSVDERYVTDPYGKAVTYNGSWASPQATSRLGNPFMHQGLWLDGECGKYQNRRREFLPALGRFAQRDDRHYEDGPSLYQRCRASPHYLFDPSGQATMWPGTTNRWPGMLGPHDAPLDAGYPPTRPVLDELYDEFRRVGGVVWDELAEIINDRRNCSAAQCKSDADEQLVNCFAISAVLCLATPPIYLQCFGSLASVCTINWTSARLACRLCNLP